jgi:preprotein translocase subunit SecA
MINRVMTRLFGTKQDRDMKRLQPTIDQINAHYEQYQQLSDDELKGKTREFKDRLAKGETLDDLLLEAFAVVKETCRRHLGKKWVAAGNEITWDMVPFDVQLAGAIILHRGSISEMATGEGKTLVATMPLYLNALAGGGVHLVTVNDYLAQRDREWMGPIYEFLGLTVGCILMNMEPAERRKEYACDITYGTNNEFGFDYLRDNMTISEEGLVQRGHYYAIVDEVDNVLIDEARTPLIISGPVDRSTQRYDRMQPRVAELVQKQNLLVNRLLSEAQELLEQDGKEYEAGIKMLQAQKGGPKNKRFMKLRSEPSNQRLIDRVEMDFMRDKRIPELEEDLFYVVDEKGHTIDLTEKGRQALSPDHPEMFVLPDLVEEVAKIEARTDIEIHQKEKFKESVRTEHEVRAEELHNISQLLRAYSLFEKDVDYVIQDNKVIIVDEFTGRLMPGRRYSDGLHQALEAKEHVQIERETQTLATITLQNYFRMYEKLAGMTGTAETEAQEFHHTYKMDVTVVPTNRPVRRVDHNDVVYRTRREKYNAIIDEIARLHEMSLPVLVGTVSVEVSETLSRMLRRKGISHSVLNAKYHAKEAEIIREAGKAGSVTIATNMAGRGTDIKLGPGVVKCPRCCIECDLDCDTTAECKGVKTRDQYRDCLKECPCGLQIVGTERHEARRIDRQLRGRSGRQGDPGASRFFLSLEDDLMRLFGSDRISGVMARLGMKEGEEIQHPMITRAIGRAQKKIEEINFERRKRTLEYDNVMNKQREAIYSLRREVLLSKDLKDVILDITYDALVNEFPTYGDRERSPQDWDVRGFIDWIRRNIPYQDFSDINADGCASFDDFITLVMKRIKQAYEMKARLIGDELMLQLGRLVVLRTIDTDWQDHLLAIDELREGVHLRAYAQLDPLVEYQREATRLFNEMMYNTNKEILERFFRTQIVTEDERARGAREMQYRKDAAEMEAAAAAAAQAGAEGEAGPAEPGRRPRSGQQPVRVGPKIGRNEPCPCGSGKKYKKCCGAKATGVAR